MHVCHEMPLDFYSVSLTLELPESMIHYIWNASVDDLWDEIGSRNHLTNEPLPGVSAIYPKWLRCATMMGIGWGTTMTGAAPNFGRNEIDDDAPQKAPGIADLSITHTMHARYRIRYNEDDITIPTKTHTTHATHMACCWSRNEPRPRDLKFSGTRNRPRRVVIVKDIIVVDCAAKEASHLSPSEEIFI